MAVRLAGRSWTTEGKPTDMIIRNAAAFFAALAFGVASAAPLDLPETGDSHDAPEAARPLLGDMDLGGDLERLSAAAAAEPSGDATLDGLAARLTTPEAAFAFVRDSIALESYGGILRGADGTLLNRAGNAADRALLLAGLLSRQGLNTRFAFAALDETAQDRLYARVLGRRPLADAPQTPFVAAIDARAAKSYAALQAAAAPLLAATLDAEALRAQARADLAAHVWVEAEIDGRWVAFDSAAGDLAMGETLTAAERTEDALPDALNQFVTIRVIADRLTADGLTEVVWLEHRMNAVEASAFPATLVFADPAGAAPGAGAWGDAAGLAQRAAVLMTRDNAIRGETVSLSGPTGDDGAIGALGGLGEMGTDEAPLTGVTLSLEFDAPGNAPLVTRRMLFDRIGAAGRVTLANGEPFELDRSGAAEAAAGAQLRAATYGQHAIHIYNGATNLTGWLRALDDTSRAAALALIEADLDAPTPHIPAPPDALLHQAAIWRALPFASDALIVPAVNAHADLRAYADRPRAMIVSHELDLAAKAVVTTIDWAQDRLRFVPGVTASAADIARYQLWFGALQGALEAEFGLAAMQAAPLEPSDASLTASDLTALRAVGRDEAQAGGLARARALAADMIVLASETGDARLYWEIDPATGATRAMAEPGAGAHQAVRTIAGAIDNDTIWRLLDDGRIMRERDFQEARRAQAKLRAHISRFRTKAEADAFYKKNWGRRGGGGLEYQLTLEMAIDQSVLAGGLYGSFVGGGMLLGTFAILEAFHGRDWTETVGGRN